MPALTEDLLQEQVLFTCLSCSIAFISAEDQVDLRQVRKLKKSSIMNEEKCKRTPTLEQRVLRDDEEMCCEVYGQNLKG